MMAAYSPNENELLELTLEERADSGSRHLGKPIRPTIVPYRRYDGRLIRLVYDVYRYDADSEIYCLRPNEGLLNNYK